MPITPDQIPAVLAAMQPASAMGPMQPAVPVDPMAEQRSKRAIADDVNQKYTQWREPRRSYEQQWYINAAFDRGYQNANWNEQRNQLEVKSAPSWRERLILNHIRPKNKARQSKFLRNKFIPSVIPASSDREDKLNAEATQSALEYIMRKQHWEEKYKQIVQWSTICGKSFMLLRWDEKALGKVQPPKDPLTGLQQPAQEAPMGDVVMEVVSPFEILPKDSSIPALQQQPEFIRAVLRTPDYLKQRYGELAANVKADTSINEAFQYSKQISDLHPNSSASMVPYGTGTSSGITDKTHVVVKEYFRAPCAEFPKGQYAVVVGDEAMKVTEELPQGGWETPESPYPIIEFADGQNVGQFWPTTMIEQLIPVQRIFNRLFSKVIEHINLSSHPKIIIPLQAQLQDGAWDSRPGEIIRINWYPGLPAPMIVRPEGINNDVWQALNMLEKEFDNISNIFPVSQGQAGTATSGFQTNLLQEAADSIHAPDIRLHEMAAEELCYKLRHYMQMGYDVPRLISIIGRHNTPSVLEFSSRNIDTDAEIVIQTNSALSSTPAIRQQQVLELWDKGILGDLQNAEVQRKALTMLDFNGIGELQEERRRDEDLARLENLQIEQGNYDGRVLTVPKQQGMPPQIDPMTGMPMPAPSVSFPEAMPWEDHDIHWSVHTDEMKSPSFRTWEVSKQEELMAHLVWHAKYIDPYKAVELASQIGMPYLVPYVMPPMPPQQAALPPGASPPPSPPSGPTAPGGAPAGPQGAPPPPPAPPVQ